MPSTDVTTSRPPTTGTQSARAPRTLPHKGTVAQRTTRTSQSTVAPPRRYGDLVNSDEVHDEIRALGRDVSQAVATYLPRDGTSEAQTLGAVRLFGPSKASRRMLNQENEAAMLAYEKGVYVVWRCVPERVGGAYLHEGNHGGCSSRAKATHGAPRMLSGANDDFCTRIGYRARCFCGHPLAAHAMLGEAATPSTGASPAVTRSSKRSAAKNRPIASQTHCEEADCPCAAFRYIPSCPEEIGESWLSRRATFDLKAWSPKCHCGHGSKQHSADGPLPCRDCACRAYTSHWLCVVCDQPWEAHDTVWESEATRLRAGRPVREAYFPLSGIDWDVRELVLKDATGGGVLEPRAGKPTSYPQVANDRPQQSRRQPSQARITDTSTPSALTIDGGDALLPSYCPNCATIFRSAQSNFCSKCGRARRG